MNRFIFILLIILCTGCSKAGATSNMSEGTYGDSVPITRAEVAKMVAFSKYSQKDIDLLERKISFNDTNMDKWYDKYINASVTGGAMSGKTNTTFEPEGYLTLSQAQFLINRLYPGNKLKLQYNEEDKDKPISYSMWTEVFQRCTAKSGSSVQKNDVLVCATGTQCSKLGKKYVLTDRGLKSTNGVDLSEYCDSKLSVLEKDNEILAVCNVVTTEPKMENMLVEKSRGKNVYIKINGAIRSFPVESNNFQKGDRVNISFFEDGKCTIAKQ